MKHEELLAKLNKELRYCTCEGSGWGGNNCFYEENQAWIALRAVVELHKPNVLSVGHTQCVACAGFNSTTYPCPTIEAIEKELGR